LANIYFTILHRFGTKWELRYPGKKFYPQQHYYKLLNALMKPVEGFTPVPVDEILRRIDVYLNNTFFEKCSHNFGTFIKCFDMFVPPRQVQQTRRPTHAVVVCPKCKYRHYEGMPCQCKVGGNEPAPIASVHEIIEQIKKENRDVASEKSAIRAKSA
jgi:hypothetical protein